MADGSADTRALADWEERIYRFFKTDTTSEIKQLKWKQKYAPNAETLRALDAGLSIGTGGVLNLRSFVVERPPGRLAANEERYFVDANVMDAALGHDLGCARRACIRNVVSGERRLEATWTGARNALHEILDQGSIGNPARKCLYYNRDGVCVRGTLGNDPMHRRHSWFLCNIERTGAKAMRLETTIAITARRGPWKGSANFWKIRATALNYFATRTKDDALFK